VRTESKIRESVVEKKRKKEKEVKRSCESEHLRETIVSDVGERVDIPGISKFW
jgi:hypothetical protein